MNIYNHEHPKMTAVDSRTQIEQIKLGWLNLVSLTGAQHVITPLNYHYFKKIFLSPLIFFLFIILTILFYIFCPNYQDKWSQARNPAHQILLVSKRRHSPPADRRIPPHHTSYFSRVKSWWIYPSYCCLTQCYLSLFSYSCSITTLQLVQFQNQVRMLNISQNGHSAIYQLWSCCEI